MSIYGYCRISTPKQNIERQERNIKEQFPDAVIVKEIFTGTKTDGRKEWQKLYKLVLKESADQEVTIVFDSVSRMSRNAEEGFALYEELFNKGVNLFFLKEPHINTSTYRKAVQNQVSLTGSMVDSILKGINEYLLLLAAEQIKIAFDQAEKEVMDLRQRTSEGLKTAKLNGKRIGTPKGSHIITKKSIRCKADILKYSYSFGGILPDKDLIRMLGVTRKTYYKYKKELREEEEEK